MKTAEQMLSELRENKKYMLEKYGRDDELFDTWDSLEDVLKKQVPRKPILKDGTNPNFVSYEDGHCEMKLRKWQDWVCPKCDSQIGERFNAHMINGNIHFHDQNKCDYCPKCGQRISWKELQ
jgi:rubrerythrin